MTIHVSSTWTTCGSAGSGKVEADCTAGSWQGRRCGRRVRQSAERHRRAGIGETPRVRPPLTCGVCGAAAALILRLVKFLCAFVFRVFRGAARRAPPAPRSRLLLHWISMTIVLQRRANAAHPPRPPQRRCRSRGASARQRGRPGPGCQAVFRVPQAGDDPGPRRRLDPVQLPENGFSAPVMGAAGSVYKLGFEGISQYDGALFGRNFIPPDTIGAVGGSQYMSTTNGAYAVFDKNTGARLSIQSDLAFWSAAGQTGANGDTRVMYNANASRWVAISFGASTSDIQIAVLRFRQRAGRLEVHQVHRLRRPGLRRHRRLPDAGDGCHLGLHRHQRLRAGHGRRHEQLPRYDAERDPDRQPVQRHRPVDDQHQAVQHCLQRLQHDQRRPRLRHPGREQQQRGQHGQGRRGFAVRQRQRRLHRQRPEQHLGHRRHAGCRHLHGRCELQHPGGSAPAVGGDPGEPQHHRRG